jgi:hypothetical protein
MLSVQEDRDFHNVASGISEPLNNEIKCKDILTNIRGL